MIMLTSVLAGCTSTDTSGLDKQIEDLQESNDNLTAELVSANENIVLINTISSELQETLCVPDEKENGCLQIALQSHDGPHFHRQHQEVPRAPRHNLPKPRHARRPKAHLPPPSPPHKRKMGLRPSTRPLQRRHPHHLPRRVRQPHGQAQAHQQVQPRRALQTHHIRGVQDHRTNPC